MLSINISELIWGIINFFLLYFLLKRFLYTPLISFMEKREQRIQEGAQEEKHALEEKRQTEETILAAREENRARAVQLLSRAGEANSRLRKELLEQAEDESRKQQELFDSGMDKFCAEKQSELAASRAELAALVTDRMLQN